jgi:hypothetical protein
VTRKVSVEDILESLKQTHMHVIGSSGYGKSKFLEWLMRHLTKSTDAGFCLFDWHGTLYRDVLRYLAGTAFKLRPVYILDPSDGRFVTGFNPFSTTDEDMSAQVSRRIDATVKPWGATSTDETPQLSRVLRMLYSFAAEAHATLPNAHLMLYAANQNLRTYAASLVKDDYIRQQLRDFAEFSDSYLRQYVSSTMNRLDRFLAPTAVRRMLGRESGNISIRQILDENGILLVNLSASGNLTSESGKLIAALLMNEFREAALARAGTKKRFVLFLDEFQEYVTHDIAQMLDQVRKGGLNLVLSHQHLAQLGDDESLQSSIATNARIKAVFGGLDYETAAMVANEIRLKSINRRQVERQIYGHTVLGHYVETFINKSTGYASTESTSVNANAGQSGGYVDDEPEVTGWSEAGGTTTTSTDTNSSSETESRLLMPIDGKELKSEQAVSQAEKIAHEAFNIMTMKPRELYLKLPAMPQAVWQRVPEIKSRGVFAETLKAYEEKAYERSHALPPEEVDKAMVQSRDDFFQKALNYGATLKPKKEDGTDEAPKEGRTKKPPRPRSN